MTLEELLQEIRDKIKRTSTRFTEVRFEKRLTTRISFRGQNLEENFTTQNSGGIIRVLEKGGWGIVTFNSLSNFPAYLGQAQEFARLQGGEKIELALVEPAEAQISYPLKEDFRKVSLAEKKQVVEDYANFILGFDKRIKDVHLQYTDSFLEYYYFNSEGTFIQEERPYISISLRAIARDGINIQQSFESIAKVGGFETVGNLTNLARSVAIRVIELLSAKSVKGGIYPVLCNPRLGGVFIHEAFGHLSEADYIYNDPQAATLMKLGKRVGSKILSVIDDGSLPGLLGSSQYDHEGVRTQKTYLIREGELVGRLHTRETAAKLHEKVTGNARAVSYRFPPIVRMTNTYIEKGQSKFEELLEDTKLGIYACDAYGGQTQLENFSFSAGYAYMIRKGKICEMVKDVVLAGNLFNTLKNIEAIGDDFSWDETAGGCGKAGQAPLPVTCGSPSLKIRDVIIGGKK